MLHVGTSDRNSIDTVGLIGQMEEASLDLYVFGFITRKKKEEKKKHLLGIPS